MQIFIDTLSEPRQQADKLMKFLHDNNANADNDDSGRAARREFASKHEKHLLDKGWKEGLWVGGLWVPPSEALVFPNCLYYRQTFKWATRALVGAA